MAGYAPVNDPPPVAPEPEPTQNALVESLKTGVGHVGKWLEVNDVQKVAQEVTVDTFNKYKGYVYDGPFSYRVANCIAGMSMVVFGTLGVFITGGVMNTLINFYQIGFGLLICGLESSKPWMSVEVQKFLLEYFRFMFTMTGRGCFYILAGVLIAVSAPWTNFVVGVYTVGTGVASLVYGFKARSKLMALKFTIADEVAARQTFSRYDTDSDGKITIAQFSSLCEAMQLQLSHSELEAAVALIGDSTARTISADEFCKWHTSIVASGEKVGV